MSHWGLILWNYLKGIIVGTSPKNKVLIISLNFQLHEIIQNFYYNEVVARMHFSIILFLWIKCKNISINSSTMYFFARLIISSDLQLKSIILRFKAYKKWWAQEVLNILKRVIGSFILYRQKRHLEISSKIKNMSNCITSYLIMLQKTSKRYF